MNENKKDKLAIAIVIIISLTAFAGGFFKNNYISDLTDNKEEIDLMQRELESIESKSERCTYSYQCGNNNQPLNRLGGIESLKQFGKYETDLDIDITGKETFIIRPDLIHSDII